MSDLKFKLKCLIYELIGAFQNWKEQVWHVELDDVYCCSGNHLEYPCACMGRTHRETITWNYFREKL